MKQLHPCQVLLDTDTNKSRYYEIHLGKGEDLAGEILCCVASCFLVQKILDSKIQRNVRVNCCETTFALTPSAQV